MVIRINSLRLINWQGADDKLVVFPGGESSLMKWDNGAGKSRSVDAEKWLRTGKDSKGALLGVSIKNTVHPERNKDEHIVIGQYTADRRPFELKRVYLEQWDTLTGTDQKVLKGHTTKYFKDNQVETPSSYKAILDAYAPERVWNLVTDPLYFNNNVPGKWEWTDQRQVLMEMVGDIDQSDILERAESVGGPMDIVRAFLSKQINLDSQIKTFKAQLLEMKKKHLTFEPSIKEAKHKKPKTTEKELKALDKELAQLAAKEEEIITSMTEIQNQAQEEMKAYYAKQNQVADVLMKMNNVVTSIKRQHEATYRDKAGVISGIEGKIRLLRQKIQNEELSLQLDEKKLSDVNARVATYKSDYITEKNLEFVFNPKPYEDKNCPTCGQLVQKNHDLSHIEETLKEQFNEKKVEKLQSIKDRAVELQQKIPGLESSIEMIKGQIKEKKDEITQAEFELSHHSKYDMPSEENILVEAESNEDYIALKETLDILKADVPAKPESANVDDKKAARRVIQEEMNIVRESLSDRAKIKAADDRVEELEKEEKRHGQKMAEVERDIFAITSYQSANYSLVEERVNRLFEGVSFKLFKQNINGTADLICDCWYEGKAWYSLNTAKKYEAGLLCIKGFQDYYQFFAPIWIDQRESVQNIPYMPNTQIIHLQAPEPVIDAQLIEQ